MDHNKTNVLCLYGKNSNKDIVVNETVYSNYHPVLKPNGDSTEVEFIYRDGDLCSVSKNITEHSDINVQYDSLHESSKLYKFNVQLNPIVMGNCIVLNYTHRPINVYSSSGVPQVFSPLDMTNILKKHINHIDDTVSEEKVVIFKLHTINNPNFVSRIYDDSENYINSLKDQLVKNKSPYDAELRSILNFIISKWGEIVKYDSIIDSKSFTVVTYSIIPYNDLVKANNDSIFKFVNVETKGLKLTLEPIKKFIDIKFILANVLDKNLREIIGGDFRLLFLVDKESKIGPKFYNIGDTPSQLSRRSTDLNGSVLDDGLYAIISDNNNFTISFICKLEEVENLDYLFNSASECRYEKEALEKKFLEEKETLLLKFKEKEAEIKQREAKIKEELELIKKKTYEKISDIDTDKKKEEYLFKKEEFEWKQREYELKEKLNKEKGNYESLVTFLKTAGVIVSLGATLYAATR